ncbi:MAG: UDP-N-acetylglucosamine 2-epimerase (hydrolyzing) [SAR202 cluster bacterium]|nr:UDP-N-acetylglucosamine 2-epimerase (hydrolyzing) [SAR202 cluster bacterium]
MRTVGVITGSRSDYGIYLPLLRGIQRDSSLDLLLFVTGSHPISGPEAPAFEQDGFQVSATVELSGSSDSPQAMAESMGTGTIGFSRVFDRVRPDVLVLQGDRFEMHAAAVAAAAFNIPIAHMHGGEITEGAIDDAFRHSMTKLSHLHFVANEKYRRRVIQMGEEPWRVVVSGAPSLENIHTMSLLDREEWESQTGFDLSGPVLLVTFHPVTLESDQTGWQVAQMLDGIKASGMPAIFTAPNSDVGGETVRTAIKEYIDANSRAHFVESLGTLKYFSLMSLATCMVGNSSSGLVEAPSFSLPVVNIGTRQDGRIKAQNVIDVGYSSEEIAEGIRRAVGPGFAESLRGLANPYGDGKASEIILEQLRSSPLDDRLLRKRFYDVTLHGVTT